MCTIVNFFYDTIYDNLINVYTMEYAYDLITPDFRKALKKQRAKT